MSLKTTITVESLIDYLLSRHSSYLHIISYIHRVFDKQRRNAFIASEKLQSSFLRIIYNVQQLAFKEEINDLLNKETNLKPCFQKLSPFLDEIQCCK